MRILGISAYYHDSAAAVVEDGVIVAAAQEERFSRKKHDSRFPIHAVRYCLAEAGGEPDAVAFYDKPILKFGGSSRRTWRSPRAGSSLSCGPCPCG